MSDHLSVVKPHDYDCLSRHELGAPCSCTKSGKGSEHPSLRSRLERLGGIELYAEHGGIAFELYAEGQAKPMFAGWAINPDALETQLVTALDGLGEFYEELEQL